MGYARAADMIALVGETAAVQDHLRYNLFPSPGAGPMQVQLAIEAIDACFNGEASKLIARNERGNVTAGEVAEGWCLGAFIDAREHETEVVL